MSVRNVREAMGAYGELTVPALRCSILVGVLPSGAIGGASCGSPNHRVYYH